jgi:hypothetical protein
MQNPPDLTGDPQSDLALTLPRDAFYEIMRVLRGALPPPETDEPAAWLRRDRAALAAVAGLQPETGAEGRMAAQFVAADAYALDCLRLAQVHRHRPDAARRCVAQAMSMMRESKSAWRLLMQAQAKRRALAQNEAAAGRAAWAEHGAGKMMAEALAAAPEAPPAPPLVPPPVRQARREAWPVVAAPSGVADIVAAATAALRTEIVSRGATGNRKMRRETAARFSRGLVMAPVSG